MFFLYIQLYWFYLYCRVSTVGIMLDNSKKHMEPGRVSTTHHILYLNMIDKHFANFPALNTRCLMLCQGLPTVVQTKHNKESTTKNKGMHSFLPPSGFQACGTTQGGYRLQDKCELCSTVLFTVRCKCIPIKTWLVMVAHDLYSRERQRQVSVSSKTFWCTEIASDQLCSETLSQSPKAMPERCLSF